MKRNTKQTIFYCCLIFVSLILPTNLLKAQTDKALTLVEQMPVYAGGEEKMYEFLSTNINYPAFCKENNIMGRVIAQFIVTSTGEIDSVKILASPHQTMSDECVRVIKLMPNWTPGKQMGKPVNVFFTLPIAFQLDNTKPKKRN